MSLDPTRLCQIEIQVSDLARAELFYAQAFGWPRVPAGLHEYVVLQVPESCSYGISLVPAPLSERRSGNLVLYFAVDDPEAVLRAVEAHGGKRRFGPTNVAGYGFIYQCEDPDGTRFGLYTQTKASNP